MRKMRYITVRQQVINKLMYCAMYEYFPHRNHLSVCNLLIICSAVKLLQSLKYINLPTKQFYRSNNLRLHQHVHMQKLILIIIYKLRQIQYLHSMSTYQLSTNSRQLGILQVKSLQMSTLQADFKLCSCIMKLFICELQVVEIFKLVGCIALHMDFISR